MHLYLVESIQFFLVMVTRFVIKIIQIILGQVETPSNNLTKLGTSST